MKTSFAETSFIALAGVALANSPSQTHRSITPVIPSAMRLRHSLLLTLLLALHGPLAHAQTAPDTTASDAAPATAVTSAAAESTSALTPQILYQLLLAEVAAQRGQWQLASAAYLDLANDTRDVGIARRAAEIGLHGKQFAAALTAAQLWTELAPDDASASATLASLYVATQQGETLTATLQRSLANAGTDLPNALLRLNRVLARQTDKLAVARLVDELTVPYLTLPEARFVRAQAAANAKEPMRAVAEIDEALRLRPEWEMAAVYKFQQLPPGDTALRFAERYLQSNPEARDVRLAYARLLVAEKRYSDARREFKLLGDALPDNTDIAYAIGILALQLDDAKDAERALKQVVAQGDGRADSARFYLGQIADAEQRNDEALEWYRQVVDDEQRMNATLRGTGLLLRQGKLDDALQWLDAARRTHPADSVKLYLAEAMLLRERGQHEQVDALLMRALAEHPQDTEILYEAGLSAERLGQIDLLEKRFRQLIKMRPDSPQGYNALGYSLAERNTRLDEAAQLIDKALELAPEDYYILDSKGWVLFRRGEHEQALSYLQRAYALKAEPEIAAHIGEVLWVLGRHDDALALFKSAVQAHPGNSELIATMKRLLP
jgi:tetratricopeptide (TPR) repeat protein